MDTNQFEELVRSALDNIPQGIREQLENIDIIVEDVPKPDQLGGVKIDNENLLLGLYEGIPITLRDDYSMVLPDKITLFKEEIEKICDTEEDIVEEIQKTVIHEVAHHFGINDATLDTLGI